MNVETLPPMSEKRGLIEHQKSNHYKPDNEKLVELRYRVYNIMKHIITERHELGLTPDLITKRLIGILNISLDAKDKPINFWDYAKVNLSKTKTIASLIRWGQMKFIGHPFRK